MRSPLSQKLLLLLTYTLLVSARETDIHIDLDSPKPHRYETPFLGPQQVPDHNATLNFDNLPPGAPVDRYGFLVWTPSIRVAQAASLASSKPNAILISQYNADGILTHPGFHIDNATATFKTLDLLGFFIAPAYEPRNKRPTEFNVSVMATGTDPGRALSTMVTLRGPKWPQQVVLSGFRAVATVTVEMTSQIAPTGAPFMPMFLMDDVSIYWRRVEGDGEEAVSVDGGAGG